VASIRENPHIVNGFESKGATTERRNRWPAFLLWSIFIVGLLVQGLAPRLKIERNAFVMPQAMTSGGKEINPTELVERERRMQLLSLLLTVTGAVGLGVYYREALFGRRHSQ